MEFQRRFLEGRRETRVRMSAGLAALGVLNWHDGCGHGNRELRLIFSNIFLKIQW